MSEWTRSYGKGGNFLLPLDKELYYWKIAFIFLTTDNVEHFQTFQIHYT